MRTPMVAMKISDTIDSSYLLRYIHARSIVILVIGDSKNRAIGTIVTTKSHVQTISLDATLTQLNVLPTE